MTLWVNTPSRPTVRKADRLCREEDAGGSEGQSVMGWIGVSAPTRKGADFLQVSQDENTEQTFNQG